MSASRDLVPTLQSVTRAALADMPWLNPSDAALRALALRLAAAIDASASDLELVATLVPKYHSVLRDLGGTPASRREFNVAEPEEDLITELRSIPGGKA